MVHEHVVHIMNLINEDMSQADRPYHINQEH